MKAHPPRRREKRLELPTITMSVSVYWGGSRKVPVRREFETDSERIRQIRMSYRSISIFIESQFVESCFDKK